jgi:nucleoside-diphosphate-sugar epimerase
MTNLVTGAAGFIGSHVVEELLAQGEPVRAFLRSADQRVPWQAGCVRPRCSNLHPEIVTGDMRDPDAMRHAVEGVKVVYHCAAAGENIPPRDAHGVTLAGLGNMLEALRLAGGGRVVLLSGLSVLGLRNSDSLTEEVPCRSCADPEIDAKLKAEEMAWDYRRTYGLQVCILRAGFVYGPRDRRNLPQLVNAIRGGSFIYIGSRRNFVPLVHVSDLARALFLAGGAPTADGRVYHIADGSRTALRELAGLICQLVGRRHPRWTLPYYPTLATCMVCEWLGRVLGWPTHGPISRSTLLFLGTSRYVDIRRAREELGFTPRIGYRDGLPAAVRCIHEQPHDHATVVCQVS